MGVEVSGPGSVAVTAGPRLRRLRQRHNLTQAELAERIGISTSYLNLIEHGRRRLSKRLMTQAAEQLGLAPEALSGVVEARLIAQLTEVFQDPRLRGARPPREDLAALIVSAPEAGRAIVNLYRAYRAARDEMRGLNERLANDPYLSETSHQLLTLLTSIHSSAEILHDTDDLAEPQRQQFTAILVQESARLTEQVNHLFEFIRGEGLAGSRPADDPHEEVSDLIQTRRNYFPELEDIAEQLRQDLRIQSKALPDDLARMAQREFNITVERSDERADPNWASARGDLDDADPTRLYLPGSLPDSSLRLRVLSRLGAAAGAKPLDDLVNEAATSSDQARRLYRRALENYLAAAMAMPYDAYHAAAQSQRYDIEALCRQFAVSFEQACHRLTSLHRPGAEGVPFHFLRVDIAGNLSKRFSASGLQFTRFGGLCPRWNLHRAFLTPERIDRQLIVMDDGMTYFTIARAVSKGSTGYGSPMSHYSLGLGCEVSFAPRLIYADGLDLANTAGATPVGVHCRLCDLQGCGQRAFPALSG